MPPLDANERDSKLCLLSLCPLLVLIHYRLKFHNFTDNIGDIKLFLFQWIH